MYVSFIKKCYAFKVVVLAICCLEKMYKGPWHLVKNLMMTIILLNLKI